jgi:hypothetical protein
MERKLWLRRFLVVALAASATGCGESSTGTYVKLAFTSTVALARPIQSIMLYLDLEGVANSTVFTAPTQAGITLPTDGVLEIQNGAGTLTVTADAQDVKGAILATGTGSGTVARDKTIVIPIAFGAVVPDAGVDGPLGPDGPSPGIDMILDTGSKEIGADGPRDVPIVPDASLDGTTPGDLGPDSITIGPDAPLEVPGTGGVIGADAGPDKPGLGGAGGVGPGGAGGIGTGGAGGAGGSTGGFLLVVNPPSADFGVILPGNVSPPQSFTITNKGDAPTPSLIGSDSDTTHFPIVKNACSNMVLQPAGTCIMTFTFNPTASGVIRADGWVTPNTGAGAKFLLTGTGAGGPATLSLSPPSVNFGPVNLNTMATATFSLTNGGDTEAGTITVQVPPAPFSITANGCAGTLGPRSQCAFSIGFTPTVIGPASATINVQSSLGLSASANISGTGRKIVTLTIGFGSSTGAGTVTVVELAKTCSTGNNTCTYPIELTGGTPPTLTLNAKPADKYNAFAGWSGCVSTTPACSVTMDGDKTVTATFNQIEVEVTITMISLGGYDGAVSGNGRLLCKTGDGTCKAKVAATASFALTATPADAFVAWTPPGKCTGVSPNCLAFELTSPVSVTATFGPQAYMFVTSTTLAPGSGSTEGITRLDKECALRAEAGKLPGKYAAWLSTSAKAAADRVGAGGWVRVDGRPFAPDVRRLTDLSYLTVYYPPRIDEYGRDLGNNRTLVATGTTADGQPSGSLCEDYTKTTGALIAGDAASGSTAWTNYQNLAAGCGTAQHLYCFRTDLSAPSIAPPTEIPGRYAFVTASAFPVGGGIAAADKACGMEAKDAGLAGTFLAFMATSTASALSRFETDGLPWKRRDGVFVTLQPTDLVNNAPFAPIDAAVDGKLYVSARVWTGAGNPNTPGTSASTCNDWMPTGSGNTAIAGDDQTSAIPDWFNFGNRPIACGDTITTTHLMCLQQ